MGLTKQSSRKNPEPLRKGGKAVKDPVVPDPDKFFALLDFNKMNQAMDKTLAKCFYTELEIAMNELNEQKNRFKNIVQTSLGDNRVRHFLTIHRIYLIVYHFKFFVF